MNAPCKSPRGHASTARILIIPLLFLFCGVANAQDWKLVKDADGIQVYRKAVEGSALQDVRSVTRFNADFQSVLALLRDYSARPRWDEHCAESSLYQSINADEDLVYVHESFPWPVSDRDLLLRMKWKVDAPKGTAVLDAEATRDILAPKPGRVRITNATATWRIARLEDGRIEISTESHLDPNGPLPAWLINSMAAKTPYQVLLNIRRLVSNPEHTDADGK